MYIQTLVKLCFQLIFLALILQSVGAKMRVYLSQVECLISTEILQNVSCTINETSRSSFSMEFALTEVPKDIKGHFLLSVKRDAIVTDYISMDMDYCELLRSQHSNYIVRALTNGVRRVSNFQVECPFKKNKLYFVKDYTTDLKILPSYLPEFSFKTDMKINYNGKIALNFIVNGKILRN